MNFSRKALVAVVVAVSVLASGLGVYAQVKRPFRNGSVWSIGFIHMKPGMETAYLNYIATDWKKEQEALKKSGVALSYKVITTESHGATDFNIMLMTEYKDLASMEANEGKVDSMLQTTIGNDEKQMQGYRDRLAIREVLASRLGREVVLEPRQ
jgi:hypothetical protein